MRLVVATATIALSLLAGATVGARAAGRPTCPASVSGAGTYTLTGSKVYDESGGTGTVMSIACDYTPTGNTAYGGGQIVIYWVVAGHKVDPKHPLIFGCGKSDNVDVDVPSSSSWAYAHGTGGLFQDSAAGKNGSTAGVATVGSFAEPCKSAGSSGSTGKKTGTTRAECPHKKPVTKESDPVAETVAFMATRKQSGSTPALTINGGAHLKSFYCFYSDGGVDRVGSAVGNGQILQTGTPPLAIVYSLTGFPKSVVHGKVVTDTYTGKVTAVTGGKLCRTGATITVVVVKTPTSSRVSFSISGGCGSHAFSPGESSVQLSQSG